MTEYDMIYYCGIMLLAVFISSVSQVMLKKSAMQVHGSFTREYINSWVIGGYALFLLTTMMSIYALRVVPLSLGVVLESTNYFFVSVMGWLVLGEELNKQKMVGIVIILLGIIIFFYA